MVHRCAQHKEQVCAYLWMFHCIFLPHLLYMQQPSYLIDAVDLEHFKAPFEKLLPLEVPVGSDASMRPCECKQASHDTQEWRDRSRHRCSC